ncbi:LD-carboxypeptidase [Aerococcaceae bacterium DSM 111021]|nr:LD-carboxypeptidase [Aerococcaceae bacterium DSM 111021]
MLRKNNLDIESDDTMHLKSDDEVILLGCSNGLTLNEQVRLKITSLYDCLVNEFNLKVHISPTVYIDPINNKTHDATYRKEELYNALIDPNIKAIFDLSGGDLANEVLNQFTDDDWRAIEGIKDKCYLGYSDNTVIINALLLKTKITAVNFLVTNIVKDDSGIAKEGFKRVLFNNERIDRSSTFPEHIEENARVIGGNLRCYLKLAGTPYFNSDNASGLLLEGKSGDIYKIRSYFAQLDLLNVLNKVEFVVMGQFDEINDRDQQDELHKLVQTYQNKHNFKLYFTKYVGHHYAVYPFIMN